MRRVLASWFAIIILLPAVLHATDDAKSTVAKLDEAWLKAYKLADFDRLAGMYAEDALVMAPDREPLHGRKAIREFFADDFKYVPKRSITLKSLQVDASGILLMDSGEYTFNGVNTEGKPVHMVGNYITVFKNTDGKWHTAIEIWNVRTSEESR